MRYIVRSERHLLFIESHSHHRDTALTWIWCVDVVLRRDSRSHTHTRLTFVALQGGRRLLGEFGQSRASVCAAPGKAVLRLRTHWVDQALSHFGLCHSDGREVKCLAGPRSLTRVSSTPFKSRRYCWTLSDQSQNGNRGSCRNWTRL